MLIYGCFRAQHRVCSMTHALRAPTHRLLKLGCVCTCSSKPNSCFLCIIFNLFYVFALEFSKPNGSVAFIVQDMDPIWLFCSVLEFLRFCTDVFTLVVMNCQFSPFPVTVKLEW